MEQGGSNTSNRERRLDRRSHWEHSRTWAEPRDCDQPYEKLWYLPLDNYLRHIPGAR